MQLQKQNSLPAQERIKSRKLFVSLVKNGSVIKKLPFRMVWIEIPFEELHPVKVAFTVSKKNIPLAAERNRTRRIMREAYRINKKEVVEWAQKNSKGIAILLIAQLNKPPVFNQTQEKIILLLQRLMVQNAQPHK